MKPATYLHIGYPRTGTTFLQYNIFPNIKGIKNWNVGGFPKGNYKILRRLLDKLRNPDNIIDIKEMKATVESILDTAKPNLISFESLSGEIYDWKFIDMYTTAERLKAIFPNPKIIVCIRKKQSMIKSLYAQHVREGGTYTKEEFPIHFPFDERLNYSKYITFLKKTFGYDNVYVSYFEDFKNNTQQFVDNICFFMDVDTIEFTNEIMNPKYNDKQLELQRLLNHAFKTKAHSFGLPPKTLWELWNPPKKLVNNRLVRKLCEK